MTVFMKVKAAEGRKVRDPRTFELIPSDHFVSVPKTCYWLRRLADGDVIEETGLYIAPTVAAPKKAVSKTKKTGVEE